MSGTRTLLLTRRSGQDSTLRIGKVKSAGVRRFPYGCFSVDGNRTTNSSRMVSATKRGSVSINAPGSGSISGMMQIAKALAEPAHEAIPEFESLGSRVRRIRKQPALHKITLPSRTIEKFSNLPNATALNRREQPGEGHPPLPQIYFPVFAYF
jgi:hypothetical protein